MKMHKVASITLSLALLVASMATTAFAAPPTPEDPTSQTIVATKPATGATAVGVGESPVEIVFEAKLFNVSIPTKFPVFVDANGVVYKATNTKITNNTDSPIKIVSAKVAAGTSGYTMVDFTKDFKNVPVGTKEIGVQLFTKNVPVSGDADVTAANLQLIPGNGFINADYDVVLAAQNKAATETPVKITFTIDWNTAAVV